MPIREFDDDTSYHAWLAAHPVGYVINANRPPTASYLMLHRASCRTIMGIPASGRSWTRDYVKIGTDSKAEAVEWCESYLSTSPACCSSCAP
jgi:hypothetical protein